MQKLRDHPVPNIPYSVKEIYEDIHQQNNPCPVQSVQKTTENYREVPSNTELYRKHKK